jgi:hypothetical protein
MYGTVCISEGAVHVVNKLPQKAFVIINDFAMLKAVSVLAQERAQA